jgi:5'-deoxynucleotidase YfbR-like HD superfamily hydrolase
MDSIRKDIRLAGEVIRYHTWPHIRQQSIGEHTWQLTRIYLAVAGPRAAMSSLVYIQFHDVGEHWVGDAPFPIKKDNPILKAEHDRIEGDAATAMLDYWQHPVAEPISDDEHKLIKLCEFIEMWEWALEELMRGNLMAQLVQDRCWEALGKYLHDMEPGETLDRATKYVEIRANLQLEQANGK